MPDTDLRAALREADVVAALHRLNALFIGALAKADAAWLKEHLSNDFVCTLSDGRRVDKHGYLRQVEDTRAIRGMSFDEVDVRPLGEVAVIQGVRHSGSMSDRYSHVCQVRDRRWRVVVAHSTRIET